MKDKKHKGWKRILILFSIIIIATVGLIIAFISPITKYLVEKYDVKYTGREMKMDWAYVNPFTGYIHFSDFKIFEQHSDSVFFSAKGISANFSMMKLFSKTYEISSFELDQPHAIISQNKNVLNFSDLIEKFSSDSISDTLKAPLHFNILNVAIKDGEFYYVEQVIPINYSIRKVNFKSGGKYWNVDSINGNFSFLPGTGSGDVKGDFMINLNNLDYRLATVINKFDLNLIEQYMKELVSYGSFAANVDADLKAKGNFNHTELINLNGKMAINDFHFGKNPSEDYASFKKLTVNIDELDPGNKKYLFDSVMLAHPYFKYELYDSLDNLQRMFGKEGSNVKAVKENPEKFNLIIEIANYIKVIFQNFLQSDYKISSLDVTKGDIQFNDYSVREKFSAAFNPLQINADSIDKNNKWVKVYLESGIKPFGNLNVTVSVNPKNNKDFNLNYKTEKIPTALFNPYFITYTSFPMDRGAIELFGEWNVRNDKIESNNHFIMIDPRVGNRIRKKDSHWIPMRLIMAFIRERNNVIDYEIPITGDLSNPNFHLTDVITDVLKNIFVKPATTPYRMEVRNTEDEIEKSIMLNWALRQTKLLHSQEKFLNQIAKFLKANPDAHIDVHPFTYSEKEKEYILFFEAKKKYFREYHKQQSSLTEDDSISIEKMSGKDAGFVKYLDSYTKDSMIYTVQEKCNRLVGTAEINKKFAGLIKERNRVFASYFEKNNTESQVKILANENTLTFNGCSYFKINYEGAIPESLIKAYQKLSEMDDESPRKKYSKFRQEKPDE